MKQMLKSLFKIFSGPRRPMISSFPRKRESRRRIHLPVITQAHWIPAFAGMTTWN